MTIFANKDTFQELGLEPFTLQAQRLDHDCAICLRPLAVRPTHADTVDPHSHHEAVRMLECGHLHGKVCLSAWLDCGNTCPTKGCNRMLFERQRERNVFSGMSSLSEAYGLVSIYGEDRVYGAFARHLQDEEEQEMALQRENERNRRKEQERSRAGLQGDSDVSDNIDEDIDFYDYDDENEDDEDYEEFDGEEVDDENNGEDGEAMSPLPYISEEELERYAGGDDQNM